MILDVDPKVDYAFKHLFGRDTTHPILIDVLDSVLNPAPGHHIRDIDLLNPFNLTTGDPIPASGSGTPPPAAGFAGGACPGESWLSPSATTANSSRPQARTRGGRPSASGTCPAAKNSMP